MSDLFDKGLATRREVLGAAYVDSALSNTDHFNADFETLITEYCWGAGWGRTALSKRDKSLLNLVMLGALNRAKEFKLHVRGAIRNGCSHDEIKDALIQLTIYAGVPAGVEAFRLAREAMDDAALESEAGA